MQRSELVNHNCTLISESEILFSDGFCQTVEQKRRERINEKLKTLQQLIPNGTKVSLTVL
jgi:hypothetical protein